MRSVSKHLDELRTRIIIVAIAFVFFLILSIYFSGIIVNRIQNDLLREGISLITIFPAEYLITRVRIGFYLALALSLPFLLYHTISFIKPALKKNENQLVITASIFVLLLFVLGFLFSYLLFLRIGIWFLSNLALQQNILNIAF